MSSILDVAREANVAPSTVSLVINNHPRVSPATRQRVQATIKRMNYRPRADRRRQHKRHISVLYGRGMMISGELVDYCRQWIAGVRESFDQTGADVSVSVTAPHVREDPMFQRNLEQGDYDALVLMGVVSRDGYLAQAMQSKLPLVVMNQWPQRAEFSSVCVDAYAAGRLAAEHLLELGHRRIAMVLAHRPEGPASGLQAGLKDALAEQGLSPALELVGVPPGMSPMRFEDPATYEPTARQLIESGATACFCGDPAALRLADILADLGVDVPGQFSMLGWDDLGFVTQAGQRLTSIGYDKHTMGLLAGQMLQNLLTMNGSVTNLTATVPVGLTSGQTVGPCSVQ